MTAEARVLAPEPLAIDLSWPAEELSPNSRAHRMVVARFKKAARIEAGWAAKIAMPARWYSDKMPIPVHITAHPKPTGPHPDADNLIASLKAHFDGIADVIGVNDREFDAPTVSFADRCQRGKIVLSIG